MPTRGFRVLEHLEWLRTTEKLGIAKIVKSSDDQGKFSEPRDGKTCSCFHRCINKTKSSPNCVDPGTSHKSVWTALRLGCIEAACASDSAEERFFTFKPIAATDRERISMRNDRIRMVQLIRQGADWNAGDLYRRRHRITSRKFWRRAHVAYDVCRAISETGTSKSRNYIEGRDSFLSDSFGFRKSRG